MKTVSIVIPAYNEEKDLGKCLFSLKKQNFAGKMEIIVVDDGSTDKTIDVARRYNVKVLTQSHGGPGKARNLGAKKAKGEILVFVDSDMYFDKNYVKNLVLPLMKEDIIGTTHDFEVAVNTDNKWSNLWGKIRVSKESAKDVKIFRAIKRKDFLRLGGFDSKYGYADDQTFYYKYGMKPFVAKNTTCYHKNPSTLKSTYNQAKWIGKSWKERFGIFKIPIVNYLALIGLYIIFIPLALVKSFKSKNVSLKDSLVFYFIKFIGYANGLTEALLFNRVWR